MSPIDITFTIEQFKCLTQFAKPANPISPLFDPAKVGAMGRITNPQVVQADGILNEDVRQVIDILAAPNIQVNIRLANSKRILDTYLYHKADQVLDGWVTLSNHNGEIRLQAPSPINEYLFMMRVMLGSEPLRFTQVKGTLDVTSAQLLWVLLEEYRKGKKAVRAEEIRKSLEAPFGGLSHLGAYFREGLGLLVPSRDEIEKAHLRLTFLDLVKSSQEGFVPREDISQWAEDLAVIPAHLHFTLKRINSLGEIESARYWVIQGKSGALYLWYEVNNEVVYRTLTPYSLVEWIQLLLREKAEKQQTIPEQKPFLSVPSILQPDAVARYNPPIAKVKSPVGRVILSFLIGLIMIGIGLFASGYLVYSPVKGVSISANPTTVSIAETTSVTEPLAEQSDSANLASGVTTLADISVDMVNVVKRDEYTYYIFGRLKNNGPAPVSSVWVELDLKDGNENVFYSTEASALTYQIEAGGESFFVGEAYELEQPVASVVSTVANVAPAISTSSVYSAEIRNMQLIASPAGAEIIGDVYNPTDDFLEIKTVTGFFLDKGGALIGLAKTEDFNIGLRPGENMPVKVNVPVSMETATEIHGYQLMVETDIVNEIIDPPISISTTQNIFRAEGTVSIVGEVMNSGSKPIVLWGLVGALYDSSGVLMDVSYTSLGIILEPGDIGPYRLAGFHQLDLNTNQSVMPSTYLVLAGKFATSELSSGILSLDADVINTNYNLVDQWFLVHGNIINNNSQEVKRGTVIISLRDPMGNIVSTEPYWFSDLSSGMSTTYTVYLPLPEGVDPTVLTLEIIAKGE
ncbi:MAG TPA: hypothetical protein PK037_04155 [Saprospiraceae bacterium]|nr:hypothetical protein [Saprospiraceae bacterium]